jgi:phage-related minor tail protein
MTAEKMRDGFMPWAGLALGTTGFFVQHQLGSDSVFQNCRTGSPWIAILAAVAALVIIGAGAFGSWRVFAAQGETPARRVVATVSLMACALYVIGTILSVLAVMLIPGCWA